MKLDENIAAIVSGGASGLGAAVVRHLRDREVKTALFDKDEDAGHQIASDSGSTFFMVDVSDSQSVRTALSAARNKNGQEQLVVNCAGIAPAMKTVSRGTAHDPEVFSQVIAVNLVGSFHLASISAEGMINAPALTKDGERGVIINTASVAAYDGQIGQIAYAAS